MENFVYIIAAIEEAEFTIWSLLTQEARIMELELKDRVALITGASRGIGAASAKALAHHGATVVINYIKSKDKAQELLDEIKKTGGKGAVYQADVRNQDAVNEMVESTLNEFGKIDVIVNNANINFPIRCN
jgi:3-oxoacyl-[acyl-carrier protein] reductase